MIFYDAPRITRRLEYVFLSTISPYWFDVFAAAAHRQRGWVLNPVTLTKGASGCFEIGKANLASHLRRAIGADVEAFASPEDRVLETIPDPAKGSGLEE